MVVKNPGKDSMVRSLPTQSRRMTPRSIFVDQRQVLVTLGVLDFVDADCVDLAQCAMLQPPSDNTFDGIKDLVPRGTERLRSLSTKGGAPNGLGRAYRP